jgi:dual specificity protein kinase YAK1
MEQWQTYNTDPSGSARQYNGNARQSLNQPRDYSSNPSSAPQARPPSGYTYDHYQGALNAQQQSATSPITTPQLRDGNGDVAMSDAYDQHGNLKYPMRPHHQHHLSGGRSAALHSPLEPSSAAQRYSPMEVLSPSSPYAPKMSGTGQYGNPNQRQSPTRSDYPAQSPYFSGRGQTQQLPPLSPYNYPADSYPTSAVTPIDGTFSADPKSPRRSLAQMAPPNKGPVPEFKVLRSPTELRPKLNPQPPFRRANPEGGFISVSPAHTYLLSL